VVLVSDQVARVIDEAGAIANEGDVRGALSLLAAAQCRHPDPALLRESVNLRIRGFERARFPEVEWDTRHDDRFAAVQGMPEVAAGDLNAQCLRAGILGKGGLVVRNLMAPKEVTAARNCVRAALLARKALAENAEGAAENPWFQRPESVAGGPVQFDRLGGEQFTETGSVWTVDSPPSAAHMLAFYRQIGLPAMLEEYFGEPATLSVRKWVLRCVPPNNGGQSGWHQDGQFMGAGIRTVNLWIALTDCGTGADAPGMDIVADNTREIYPTGTHGAPFEWTVGQGLVDEIGRRHPIVRPHFRAGDAIFFDHYNLHRTGYGTADLRPRYAVEAWFFAASRAPASQQPLLF
jgi:hypothetical protein